MSERIRGSYDDALYKSTFTLLYFTIVIIDFSLLASSVVTKDENDSIKSYCSFMLVVKPTFIQIFYSYIIVAFAFYFSYY